MDPLPYHYGSPEWNSAHELVTCGPGGCCEAGACCSRHNLLRESLDNIALLVRLSAYENKNENTQ